MHAETSPSSKRAWLWVALALIGLGVVAWLWPRTEAGSEQAASDEDDARGLVGRASIDAEDERGEASRPGAIVGSVRDLDGAGLAGARVCMLMGRARDGAAPRCVAADDQGRYRIDAVAPGAHELFASAAEHQARSASLTVAPGAEASLDFTLLPGGVELRGVVHDLAGGPIEGALVKISGDPLLGDPKDARALVVTDEDGRFRAHVRRGRVRIIALAPGYAPRSQFGAAPGASVEIYLVPEAVLIGRLVDAESGAPVADVEVHPGVGGGGAFMTHASTSEGWARSDADGNFRIAGLSPGEFRPFVANARWRGQARQTVKLGLGETSAIVEIPLIRGATVRARVVDERDGEPACAEGLATVAAEAFEFYTAPIAADGWVEFGGLAPGDYEVDLHCDRMLTDVATFALAEGGGDLDDLRWTIPPGYDMRGTIVDGRGQPLAGVVVVAELIPEGDDERGPTARRSRSEASDGSGAFALRGLEPGSYELTLGGSSGPALATPVEVELGEQDLDGVRIEAPTPGVLAGAVIDEAGAPVPNLTITAYGAAGPWQDTRSDDQGRFELVGLGPDHYRVTALDGRWKLELTEAEVELEAGERRELELVVPRGDGVIRGRVVDDGGTALDDAFVAIARQLEPLDKPPPKGRLSYGDAEGRPILTDVDGSFEITDLPPGLYTVTAVQKQGGEAIAHDVRPGATLTLRIDAVASVGGRVIAPAEVDEPIAFSITATLADGSFEAHDRWIDREGRWRLEDIPPGRYTLVAESAIGDGELELELAPGAVVEDRNIELVARVVVRGRLIDALDGSPVADARVRLSTDSSSISGPGRIDWVRSDADGRFSIAAPAGEHTLTIIAAGSEAGRRHESVERAIDVAPSAGAPTMDLGDITLTPTG